MPNQTVERSPRAPSGHGTTGAAEVRLVTVALVLVAAGLVAAASRGPIAAIAAIVVAILVFLAAVLGRERLTILAMIGAFALAPMSRGLAPGGPESPIIPSDILFGLAVMLLAPTLLRRSLRLPLTYVIGISLIMVTGTLSTAFSTAPLASAIQFVQWLIVILGLLVLFAMWAPTWKMVDLLLWSYVAGQMVSVAYAPLGGAIGNRYQGLSHHPNEFGGAGVMAFAALMYLWRRNDAVWYRLLVAGAAAISVASVIISGSRAAAAVVAGLVLLFPIVERSAVKGFVLSILGALAVFSLPLVVDRSGEGSAIARLAGSADAIGADRARTEAQDFGIDLFLNSPIIGNGFAEALFVHNVVLGVATSVGLIGLLGYLLVLYTLARPIIGDHPNRRIGYIVAAFVAITPTFPALEDRTLWVPMAPAILLAIQSRRGARDNEATAEPAAAAVEDPAQSSPSQSGPAQSGPAHPTQPA